MALARTIALLVLWLLPSASAEPAPSGATLPNTLEGAAGGQLLALQVPALGEGRGLRVYLPPSYAAGSRRYPVLYLQDGERVFGNGAGQWDAPCVAASLAREGVEVILVGVPNAEGESATAAFLTNLVGTVKPFVDATYRTRSGARSTGIAGSGAQALLGVQAGLRYPNTFGFVAALSPLAGEDRAVLQEAWKAKPSGQAFLISIGTSEDASPQASLSRVMSASELAWALRLNGARVGYVEGRGDTGDADAQGVRLPLVLRSFQSYANN